MQFFDAHNHLQDKRIINELSAIIQVSAKLPINYMCCCGTSETDWDRLIEVSFEYPTIIPAIGIHPWYVNSISKEWFDNLEQKAVKYNTAIGECGLDFIINETDHLLQEEVFERQLILAQKTGKPVCIHCRGAWQKMLDILDKVGQLPGFGLIHSFSGSAEMVKEFEKRGFYISFSGSITNLRNKKIVKAMKQVSDNRLLIETDSPDITPQNIPDRKLKQLNKPYYIPYIAKAFAERTGIDQNKIIKNAFQNAKTLFSDYING